MTPQSVPTITHDDLVILTSYMAEHGYSAPEIAYAVEKPWKFLDVLDNTKAMIERDTALGVIH